jgi:hypothetical protein
MNPLWFDIGFKSGLYAYGTWPAVAAGIWAYESTTGHDVPILVEVGLYAASSVGAGSADHALTTAWRKHGYKGTKATLRLLPKAGKAVARATARGTVRVLTSGGIRVMPSLGAVAAPVGAAVATVAAMWIGINIGMHVRSQTHQFLTEKRGYGLMGGPESGSPYLI